jgi:hypothetical protein
MTGDNRVCRQSTEELATAILETRQALIRLREVEAAFISEMVAVRAMTEHRIQ